MATFGASKVASPALIDSGADVNVIPYHIFSQLHNTTLVPTPGKLSSFVGASANYVGYADINVHIKQISCPHRFYIMAETNSMNHVILGQPWQRTYDAYPDWQHNRVNFKANNQMAYANFL